MLAEKYAAKISSKLDWSWNIFFALISVVSLSLLFLFYPILGSYCVALLAAIFSLGRLQHIFALVSALAFSWLLVLRDPWRGLLESGLGDDAMHYMNAFYEFQKSYCCGTGEILEVGIRNTGGGEPIFWWSSYALSKFLNDPVLIWGAIILISLLLIWFAIYLSCRRFSYVIFVAYLSTITLYALQGSAIRQAMATGFVMLGLSCMVRRKLGMATLFGVTAAGFHSSAAVVLIVVSSVAFFYFDGNGSGRSKFKSPFIKICAAAVLLIIAAGFGTTEFFVSKIQARVSESQTGSAWELQLIIEAIAACTFVWLAGLKIPKMERISYLAFILICISMSFLAPSVGARLFRYTYCFYIVYFSYFYLSANRQRRLSGVFGAIFLCVASFGWAIFLVETRYKGLFVDGGVLEHFIAGPML